MNCRSTSKNLAYNIISNDTLYRSIILDKFQKFYLQIDYKGPPLKSQYSKLYLLYKGNSTVFNGSNLIDSPFTSVELPFSAYYKTQLHPLLINNLTNLWQLGILSLNYDTNLRFQFPDGYPYYIDNYPPSLASNKVQLYIKYNNDNNPFMIVTISHDTVFNGITKISGYVTIFGLIKIALILYNSHNFEGKLLIKYKGPIKESFSDQKREKKIDKKMIRELMSFDMFMKLVVNYLKSQKLERLSQIATSINNRETST